MSSHPTELCTPRLFVCGTCDDSTCAHSVLGAMSGELLSMTGERTGVVVVRGERFDDADAMALQYAADAWNTEMAL